MSHVTQVLQTLERSCAGQPEFLQAAREVLLSLEPVVEEKE